MTWRGRATHLAAPGAADQAGGGQQPAVPARRAAGRDGPDKKVEDARLRFVLARRIGDAFTSADVPSEAVRAVLAEDG